MHLIVTALTDTPTRGRLHCGESVYDCALGKSGLIEDKSEGDGATPLGRFRLRQVFYRPDRTSEPETGLPVIPLKKWDGWCDAPDDSAYNTFVSHPYKASAEHLWRDDNRYDIIVVLGHNDDPVVPGAGSAIFMHVAAEGYQPTEGCVALDQDDLRDVLSHCAADSVIEIKAATP